MKRAIGIGLILTAWTFAAGADVKSEPNLEKRSKLALDNANSAIDRARTAYDSGDLKQGAAELTAVRDYAGLCLESLNASGKNARKSPKAFKRAELQIAELLRRLKSLSADVSVDERAEVATTERRLHEIHDELISRIMSKH